jgi:hypothetical protein
MSAAVAALFLIAYFVVAIHVYLAAYASGTFKISYGPIGGTELRLLLILANLAAGRWPTLAPLGIDVRLFDVVGVALTLGLAGVLIVAVPRLASRLRREETRVSPR